MAVLVVLSVFVIGKTLGNTWIGILAAGLLAIMPGEFLSRSQIGYIDHHIGEVLFSTVTMMFIFLSIKNAKKVDGWNFKVGMKTVIYGLLGGVFLGLYIFTWAGALLFLLIIFGFMVIQAIIEHIKEKSVNYIGIMGLCIFGVCLLMYLSNMRDIMTVMALIVGIVLSIFLVVASKVFVKQKIYYPLAISGVGIASLFILFVVSPISFNLMIVYLTSMFQWRLDTTVMEMQPLLIQSGNFTFSIAMGNYMLAFFLSLLSIGILFYQSVKHDTSEKMLLLFWSIVILVSMLAMRRFSYY
jgi:dolichyl-diphosphooligosaccharide--protein glycosyltransferase